MDELDVLFTKPKRKVAKTCQVCRHDAGKSGARYPVENKRGDIVWMHICKQCNQTYTFDKYGTVVTWATLRASRGIEPAIKAFGEFINHD